MPPEVGPVSSGPHLVPKDPLDRHNRLISTPTVELPASRAASLRRWNIGLGLVHAVQAVAVLALATAFALPVATFMEGPPGTSARRADHPVRRLRGVGVALFLLLSAVFHWLVVLPSVFGRYTSVSWRSTTTFAGPSTRSRRR